MYCRFENGYDNNIRVLGFEGYYKRGDVVPLGDLGLPNDCVVATKYFADEKNDVDKYVFLLFDGGKYVEFFYSLGKIRGVENYPVFVQSPKESIKDSWVEFKL